MSLIAGIGCADSPTAVTTATSTEVAARFNISAADEMVHDSTWVISFSADVMVEGRAEAEALVQAHGGVLRRVFPGRAGFSAKLRPEAVDALRRNPKIALVSPNYWAILHHHTVQSSPGWALDRIDQRTQPLDGAYVNTATGAGVNVYIVDTGINADHPDFQGRVSAGYSSVGGSTSDCTDHGTPIGSIVGGSTYGVAKGTTLHPVKIFSCVGPSRTEDVLTGLIWIRDNHTKPAVANLSFGMARCPNGGGGDGDVEVVFSRICTSVGDAGVDTEVQGLLTAGVTVVAAAGNGNMDACAGSPGRVSGVITVAASTAGDARWYQSNWGSCVALFAPGQDVLSASSQWPATTDGIFTGTSFAAPYASGAAALYLQRHPTATPSQVRDAMTLQSTGGVISNPGTGTLNRLVYAREPGVSASVSLSGPSYAYEQQVMVSSAVSGGAHSPPYYYWEYRYCENSLFAGACDFKWHALSSGWNLTTATVFVTRHYNWVDVRLQIRDWPTGDAVGSAVHRINGAGEYRSEGGGIEEPLSAPGLPSVADLQ